MLIRLIAFRMGPLLVAALALFATQPAMADRGLAPLDCGREPVLRSLNSDRSTFVTFVNQHDESVRVYWLNFDGRRVFYRDIEPGESYRQQTFVTHPWVVTNSDTEHGAGRCLALFQPAPVAGIADIQ
jgi:hypothetical protein